MWPSYGSGDLRLDQFGRLFHGHQCLPARPGLAVSVRPRAPSRRPRPCPARVGGTEGSAAPLVPVRPEDQASRSPGVGASGVQETRRLPVRAGSGSSMSEPEDVLLGRADLERAFTALGERLAARGVVADLFVGGGAAMALGL